MAVALTLVGCVATSAAEPAPGPAGWLFDPNSVVAIDLGLSQASMEALEAEPEEEYQPATFSLRVGDQTYGPLEIGLRLKGGVGSFRALPDEKAAFKIKFDDLIDEQTFFGLEKLTLNNMVQDPSMVHETLSYEAFRAAGVAAPRTGYAFVRVNGEPFGLYLNVETLDLVALSRWFATTSHLYEGSYGADVKPGAPAFEVDEGSKKNLADLQALTAAANDTTGDWSEGMAGFADLDQMARMWAVERYVGHWDGYSGEPGVNERPNNFYLHSSEGGEFQMLPWGTDQTWDARLDFDQEGAGVLFEQCLADSSCADIYRGALAEVGAAVAGLGLDTRVDYLAQRLAPCQALETEPWSEYGAGEIADGVDGVRNFVSLRPGELSNWLGAPVPEPSEAAPTPPLDGSCVAPSTDKLPDPNDAEPAGSGTVPAQPDTAPSVPTQPQGWLRIGMARALGDRVAIPLDLPGAGQASERVAFATRHGWAGACVDREEHAVAGPLTLRCKLSERALRRWKRHALRLRIRIDFSPAMGDPITAMRHLTLPKG
jgi:hypothetical protein